MSKTILFVYGSLKRGERNHHLIRDQRFLFEVTGLPKYRLLDLGTYPGIVRDNATGLTIRGELFEIQDCALDELDEFEGSPEHYKREVIEIDGIEGPVESYFYQHSIPERARSGSVWPFV